MPGIDWVQEQGKGRADGDFLVLVQDCFITQFVDKLTRGSAVLDILLSNDPNMVEDVEVWEHLRASDHNIVCAKIMLRDRVQGSRVRLLGFRKANFEGMRRELSDVDWETLTTGHSASEKWETFKEQMCSVQSKYIPMRCKARSRKRPGWLSSEIRNAIKEKQKAFIRFKITGLELDLYHYRSKQRKVKKITQQAKREYERDMAQNIKHTSKAFFKYIRGKEQVRTSVGPLRKSTGRVVRDESEMAGLLNRYFSSTFTQEQSGESIEEVRKGFCRGFRLEWRK